MELEFRTGDVIDGVTVYANDVYVGDITYIKQDMLANWCKIQNKADVKFALRNENTFSEILYGIVDYLKENGRNGVVVSSYSGGIAPYFTDEFWEKYGFVQKEDAPKALYFNMFE